jgi:glycine/D-amino acid oxidase-like deaminating enzyme
MIEKADVVVIGSGALGASTAFHLAKLGRRVALLDQAALASQTSPRAAGLSGQVRKSELMTRLAVMAVKKIERFEADTGQPLVFYQPGSLKIARRPEHEEQLREEAARGKQLGLDIDLITPEEAQRLMPFLQTKGIRAVTHMRTDVYLEPVQIPRGYVQACAALGATLLPDTRVTGVVTEHGSVARVLTDGGEIRTGVVVDAAGAWLRTVAELAKSRVLAVPTRHQLMITEPLAEVRPEQPITRIIDANVYIRPEKGGLMLGGYEANPVQYDMRTMRPDFRVEQLELDLAVVRRLAESVYDQLPVFRDAKVREHRGGLPTMTADGEHVIGPVPGVGGLYVVGGCCVGGLSTAPAIGELLAEWITTGKSSLDLSRMSPARFSASLSEEKLRDLCRAQYAHQYWSPESIPGGGPLGGPG